MNFASDNVVGAADEILDAIRAANSGPLPSYGADPISARVQARFEALFDCPVTVFLVASGTAANALALSALVPRYGVIYCHREAHIEMDECGAPEFFTGGAKLTTLDGAHGKITPEGLRAAIGGAGFVHASQPAAISLTNLSECGSAWTPDEVAAIADVARAHGLWLHMDGARFGNALAGRAFSPADVTWRAGVDALSFGASKNGALACEAILLFGRARERAEELAFLRKRGGHLLSKMRLLAAQMDAYLADELWLKLAARANAAAAQLAVSLSGLTQVKLLHPVDGNELFLALPVAQVAALREQGFHFYDWPTPAEEIERLIPAAAQQPYQAIRLITAFNSPPEAVTQLAAALGSMNKEVEPR